MCTCGANQKFLVGLSKNMNGNDRIGTKLRWVGLAGLGRASTRQKRVASDLEFPQLQALDKVGKYLRTDSLLYSCSGF